MRMWIICFNLMFCNLLQRRRGYKPSWRGREIPAWKKLPKRRKKMLVGYNYLIAPSLEMFELVA